MNSKTGRLEGELHQSLQAMVRDPMEVVLGKTVQTDALHTINSLVVPVLDACELIFKTDCELADVADDGRSESPHLIHVREAVLAEIET